MTTRNVPPSSTPNTGGIAPLHGEKVEGVGVEDKISKKIEIYRLYVDKGIPTTKIAEMYGLSRERISQIIEEVVTQGLLLKLDK